jgi:hypothetical protein
VLAIWLLGFRFYTLSRGERVYVVLLATASVAVHLSHLPLAVTLAGVGACMRWSMDGLTAGLRSAARMAAPALLAMLALAIMNMAAHRIPSISPFGSVFLAARLIFDDPGKAYLERNCPKQRFRICAVRDRLSENHNHFLWDSDSPLYTELGGPKQWSGEAAAIVAGTLAEHPGGVAKAVLSNTAIQFLLLGIGDELQPRRATPGPEPLIERFFPAEHDAYVNARQQRGTLERLAQGLVPLHTALTMLAMLALLLLAVAGWRSRTGPALATLVLVAMVANAAFAGGLSGPAERYQARLGWLPVFALGLGYAARRRSDGEFQLANMRPSASAMALDRDGQRGRAANEQLLTMPEE